MAEMHYNISPSSLYRWMACPASYQEEKKYPEKPVGAAAIDGTHTHTLLEHCVKAGLRDAFLMIGEELEDHEGKFEVDAERAQRANVAIHYLQQRKMELGVCAIRAEETADPGQYLKWDDWKGTCDVTVIGNEELEVIDYKDGRTLQSPNENPQLMSYALGRCAEYNDWSSPVKLTIIQPRCNPPISHHTVEKIDLLSFVEDVNNWRVLAESDNPPFNPGEKQCRWCNARSGCAAMQQHALNGVGVQFQNLEVANQAAEKDPSQMSDEQLTEFIEGIPLLKQAIAAAEEEALRRFEAGHKVPGLKAVRGRGKREWALEETDMAQKLTRMGIPKSALYVTKLISPAQANKVQWEKRDGSKHTLSTRQMKTLDSEYIKKTPGKITIVPESDDRDEVVLGVSQLFEPIEQVNELPAELML